MVNALFLAKYFNERHLWNTAGDDTQYIIRYDSGYLYIFFKQSDSQTDWKNNFSFFARPYKQMETTFFVHGGFLRCWKLVEDIIMQKVGNLVSDENVERIVVTGWSYGGALALMCKEALWFHFPQLRDMTECVTFGSPRILWLYNYDKVKERWNNTRQFTNGSDVVTCVPPLAFGFRHPTTQIHIGDIRQMKMFANTDYHHIKEYIKTLEKIV